MNKINIQEKYKTARGTPVRLLCTDAGGKFPVVGLVGEDGTVETFTENGHWMSSNTSSLDLKLASKYDDWPIDAKVVDKDNTHHHFAGAIGTTPYVWDSGKTSHTTITGQKVHIDNLELA